LNELRKKRDRKASYEEKIESDLSIKKKEMYAQIGRHIQDIKTYQNFIASSKTVHTQCKPFTKKKTREITNYLWKLVKKNLDAQSDRWNWSAVSENPNITPKIISKHPELPWVWENISFNTSVTWDFVLDNIKKPWIWHILSANTAMTWEIIKNNRTLPDGTPTPWDLQNISKNPNITPEIIKNNPTFPWSLTNMVYNPNLTWDSIKDLGLTDPYIVVDQEAFEDQKKNRVKKKYISPEKILKRDGENTDWYALSKNEKLTYKFIMENKDKPFTRYYIYLNKFGK
jgi:hypothetical protein